MVSMHMLVDGSSLWWQRLQHIDITRLSYNAVRQHGTRLPRYKEGRLFDIMVPDYRIIRRADCTLAQLC